MGRSIWKIRTIPGQNQQWHWLAELHSSLWSYFPGLQREGARKRSLHAAKLFSKQLTTVSCENNLPHCRLWIGHKQSIALRTPLIVDWPLWCLWQQLISATESWKKHTICLVIITWVHEVEGKGAPHGEGSERGIYLHWCQSTASDESIQYSYCPKELISHRIMWSKHKIQLFLSNFVQHCRCGLGNVAVPQKAKPSAPGCHDPDCESSKCTCLSKANFLLMPGLC